MFPILCALQARRLACCSNTPVQSGGAIHIYIYTMVRRCKMYSSPRTRSSSCSAAPPTTRRTRTSICGNSLARVLAFSEVAAAAAAAQASQPERCNTDWPAEGPALQAGPSWPSWASGGGSGRSGERGNEIGALAGRFRGKQCAVRGLQGRPGSLPAKRLGWLLELSSWGPLHRLVCCGAWGHQSWGGLPALVWGRWMAGGTVVWGALFLMIMPAT